MNISQTLGRWVGAWLLMMIAFSAKASEPYVIEGLIDEAKFADLQIALATMTASQTIEFRQCFGWQQHRLEQFQQVAKLLSEKKLRTAAKGLCTRECAALFLLGSHKTLHKADEGKKTAIIFHPLLNDDNELLIQESRRLLEEIVINSNGKIPLVLFDRLFDVEDEMGGVAIYRDVKEPGTNVFFSAGRKHKPAPIVGYTLEKLGISID